MSLRYKGGVLSTVPPTTSTSTAVGVWTMRQQMQAQGVGVWPLLTPIDAKLNYVTMLLHGNGTDGAQNNTFTDSSSYNSTITRAGTVTQGTNNPFGQNWSNYFPGTSYLYTASNAAFQFGTGDFTIECWINMSRGTALLSYWASFLSVCTDGTTGGSGVTLYVADASAGSTIAGEIGLNVGSGTRIFGGQDVRELGWVHVAATRVGTTVRLFVNGVQKSSATNSLDINATEYGAQIGLSKASQNNYFVGNVSNVRIVKGTALYTNDFTPSTTPLTAVSGTSLLTCKSNRFIDTGVANSGSPFVVYPSGTPSVSVQRFNPFGTATAYSTSTFGGTLQNLGAGNYLSMPNTNFDFGSGNWTVELWYYYVPSEAYSSYATFFDNGEQGLFLSFGGTKDNLLLYSSTAQSNPTGFQHGMRENTWNHIAWVRNGSTGYIYVNGASIGSIAMSGTCTGSGTTAYVNVYSNGLTNYYVGSTYGGLRIVKGTAVYTANFPPPTTPPTAISGTVLLLNGTGGIYDNAMMNDLQTVGNAQISTAQSKFGGSSMYFDGTGDYLIAPKSQNLDLGAVDFTIEAWIYPQAEGGKYFINVNGATSSYGQVAMAVYGTAKIEVDISTSNNSWTIVYSSPNNSITLNTWNHVALVRVGSAFTLYLNGVGYSVGSTSSALYNYNGNTYIGSNGNSSYMFNGYIEDLRITKGYARYTANFTPSTTEFPNVGPVAE